MKYFARITQDHWTHKNNLDAAVHRLFKENDATLINSTNDRNDFVLYMHNHLQKLNDRNARCKPKRMHTFGPSDAPTCLYVAGVVHMEIIQVANEWNIK